MLAGTVAFLTTLSTSLRKQPEAIQTTLYDLIATMQDATMQDADRAEDDALIVNTVTELISTGQIRFLNEIGSQGMGR